MLTGNPAFKAERAAVWADIHNITTEMDRLSANWTNPDNVERWATFKSVLNEFAVAQQKVEDIAHTPDEQPATDILVTQAAPRAATIVKSITGMIDAEQNLAATPERKAILGMMADVRGTMGMSLANIRAFLLTGQDMFREKFDEMWSKNERRFKDLEDNAGLMSTNQKKLFAELSTARKAFAPLPSQMFEIRASEKWNMANYLLVTEAAPRAGKLLTVLAGAKKEDGQHAGGGMVDNQRVLLADDARNVAEATVILENVLWGLLFVGLAVGVAITVLTARSIARPILSMTIAMKALAEGDKTVSVPARGRTDEIGGMAEAVQVFKEDAVRMDEMAAQQQEQKRIAEDEKRKAMFDLADNFEASVGEVVTVMSSSATEMQTTAQSLSEIAKESSSRATSVAAATEEAVSYTHLTLPTKRIV